MEQSTILIVSDDAEFSNAVTGRWQVERNMPSFTLVSGDLCHRLDADAYDLAIAGPVRPGALPAVLATLDVNGKPILFVCGDGQLAQGVRDSQPRVMVLRQYEGWLDALVLVCAEVLRRVSIEDRAQRAEQANTLLESQATLGSYILEMRHTLNNALTSVLGNSELLLSEPGSFSAAARSQMETIRDMALRMHEILQRFSSLEKEFKVVEKQAGKGKRKKSKAASAGPQSQ